MARCPSCFRRLAAATACPVHHLEAATAERPEAVEVPPDPPLVPGYELHEHLGAGGSARVYSASRDSDGEQVALKVATLAGDWRFRREADALARVSPPHAPRLIELGEANGFPFIAMELVSGMSAAHWLESQAAPAPPRNEAVNVLRAICLAVDAIHGCGLVHRDLKPENVLLHDRGVTIIDFGLAREPEVPGDTARPAQATMTGQRLGTPLYMAPEQCLGSSELSFQTDIYAIGVIAFELLCGRPPFVGSVSEIEERHVHGRPPPLSSFADVPAGVDAVLARALAKLPERRHATAGQLYAELLGALEGRGRRRSKPSPRPRVEVARSGARSGQTAILAVDAGVPVQRLRESAALEDGELVRTSRPWYLIVFPGALVPESGIRAAINLAGRLGGLSTTCVVHLAPIRVKQTGRGVIALGRALDRVSSWAPDVGASSSLLLTAAAARVFPETTRESSVPGYFVWRSENRAGAELRPTSIRMRGRDALVAALAREGERASGTGTPTMSTVVGDIGAGKSRLLGELAKNLASSDVTIIELGAVPPPAGAAAEIVAEVRGAEKLAPHLRRQLVARRVAERLRQYAAQRPVVVLVDDAHLADAALLDGLEQATATPGVPLWVVAVAGPELDRLRPSWGQRAVAEARHQLGPLDLEAARGMLLDLLSPAEFIHEAVLARLVELSEGVPLQLVEVAQLFRAEGRIRRLRGTDSFFVDAGDLVRVSATPLTERLAERMLRSMPSEIVALAQVVAILESDVTQEAVDSVGAVFDGFGDADSEAGLARLARSGMIVPVETGYRVRNRLLCEAVRATIEPGLRRRLHRAAAAFLESQRDLGPDALAQLASHAAACGLRDLATRTWLRLGDAALASLDRVSAERHYTAALGQLAEGSSEARQRALLGRGGARVRLRNLASAVDDLIEARGIAMGRGDRRAAASALLEEAIARDLAFELPEAEELVERAVELAATLDDPRIEARCRHGLGRSHFRAERHAEAARDLAAAVRLARATDDYETEVAAMLHLGPALAALGQLEEAERVFDEVIERCERAGDMVHLGAAYGNRSTLWNARRDPLRAVDDLYESRRCARIAGHATVERIASHNLAEQLLWLGRLDEALPSAVRSRDIEARYDEAPIINDSLLLARIHCARGAVEEAAQLLEWIGENICRADVPPSQALLLEAVELRCRGGMPASWEALIERSAQSAYYEQLEIASLGVEALLAAGDPGGARRLLERAEALEPAAPWAGRFTALAEKLG